MLKESYLANIRNLPADAVKIVVTRTAGHVLSPSWSLLNDYKHEKINWDQYVERFRQEMNNDICRAEMRKIKWEAKIKDIFFLCYEKDSSHCHRSILLEMISHIDE